MDIDVSATNEGMRITTMKLVCRTCGHEVRPGEPQGTCPECGGHDFHMVEDRGKHIVLKCAV